MARTAGHPDVIWKSRRESREQFLTSYRSNLDGPPPRAMTICGAHARELPGSHRCLPRGFFVDVGKLPRLVEAEFFQLAVKRGAADAEAAGDFGHVAVIMIDGHADNFILDLFELA